MYLDLLIIILNFIFSRRKNCFLLTMILGITLSPSSDAVLHMNRIELSSCEVLRLCEPALIQTANFT